MSKKRRAKAYEVVSVDKGYRYGVFPHNPLGKKQAKDYIFLLKKTKKEKFKINIL